MIYRNIQKEISNGLVYVKGKFLKLNNKEFSYVLKLLKESLIQKLSKEIDYKNIEKIKYLKWCYDNFSKNIDSCLKISYNIITFRVAHRKMWKLFFKG